MKNLKNYIISLSITLGIYCYNNLYLPNDTDLNKKTNNKADTDHLYTNNDESKEIVTNSLKKLADKASANTQQDDLSKTEIDNKINSIEISEDNNQFTDYMTLENLAADLLSEPDYQLRQVLLDEILFTMNSSNALNFMRYLKDKPLRYQERSTISKAFGKVLGEVALNEVTANRDRKNVIEGWAAANPDEAINWFYELSYDEGEITQKMTANSLLYGVGQTDTNLASEVLHYVGDVDSNPWGPVTSVMLNVWKNAEESENPEFAQNWAETLPEGELRNFAIDQIAHRMAKTEPLDAIAWLEENDKYKDRGLDMVVNAWSRNDPAAAAEWLMEQGDDGVNYGRGYYHSFKGMGKENYDEAIKNLDSIYNEKYRDHAILGISKTVKDPTKAIELAVDINNDRIRINLVTNVVQKMARKSPDTMLSLLAGSNLDYEDQEKVLDKVLAKLKP